VVEDGAEELKGINLDKLRSVCFKPSTGDNQSMTKPDSQLSATQITVDVSSARLAQGDSQTIALLKSTATVGLKRSFV
jgi:hypothetical protein